MRSYQCTYVGLLPAPTPTTHKYSHTWQIFPVFLKLHTRKPYKGNAGEAAVDLSLDTGMSAGKSGSFTSGKTRGSEKN
jgi:hypothetical protein